MTTPDGAPAEDRSPVEPGGEAAPEPALIRCPNCYHSFSNRNKFCPKCGRSREELDEYVQEKRAEIQIKREAGRASDAIYGVTLFYSILIALNFVAVYVLPRHKPWTLLAADSVLIVVTLIWACINPAVLSGRFGVNLPLLLFVPLSALGTYLVASVNSYLFLRLSGLYDFFKIRGTESFLFLRIPLSMQIVSICVVPGIFEELFFRGMMQGTLEKTMSRRDAWLVQGVVFAIAHVNPVGFFTYLLFLGLYLGWLRNRTGSLLPGMGVHFSHNLLVVLNDYYHWVKF